MKTLSFVMPTRSRARDHVSTALLVHASNLDTSWHEGASGTTTLFVLCEQDREDRVRRAVAAAHPVQK